MSVADKFEPRPPAVNKLKGSKEAFRRLLVAQRKMEMSNPLGIRVECKSAPREGESVTTPKGTRRQRSSFSGLLGGDPFSSQRYHSEKHFKRGMIATAFESAMSDPLILKHNLIKTLVTPLLAMSKSWDSGVFVVPPKMNDNVHVLFHQLYEWLDGDFGDRKSVSKSMNLLALQSVRNVKDTSHLPRFFTTLRHCYDSLGVPEGSHWSLAFLEDSPLVGSVIREGANVVDFRRCLKILGLAPNKAGETALDFAMKSGDAEYTRSCMEHQESSASADSSTLKQKEFVTEAVGWAETNGQFLELLLNKNKKSGEQCLSYLRECMVDWIKDQKDCKSLDIFGVLWQHQHSQKVLWNVLRNKLKSILDYNTLHKNSVDWNYFNNQWMRHPLWLFNEGKEYRDLLRIVQEQESNAKGAELKQSILELVKKDMQSWKDLVTWELSDVEVGDSPLIRQDMLEYSVKPGLSEETLNEINLKSSSFDYDALKEFDMNAFVTQMLSYAHLLNPVFQKKLKPILSHFGNPRFGPVKQATRIREKSETDYFSHKDEGYYWPFSAYVLDLIRCSVTVNTLKELISTAKEFVQICENDEELQIVRYKNGFSKFMCDHLLTHTTDDVCDSKIDWDDLPIPSQYVDVKFNLAVSDKQRKIAIIGEVQILLKCVLRSKRRGHELYEITRNAPFIKRCTRALKKETFQRSLIKGGANPKFLRPLLVLMPHKFTFEELKKPLKMFGHSSMRSTILGLDSSTPVAAARDHSESLTSPAELAAIGRNPSMLTAESDGSVFTRSATLLPGLPRETCGLDLLAQNGSLITGQVSEQMLALILQDCVQKGKAQSEVNREFLDVGNEPWWSPLVVGRLNLQWFHTFGVLDDLNVSRRVMLEYIRKNSSVGLQEMRDLMPARLYESLPDISSDSEDKEKQLKEQRLFWLGHVEQGSLMNEVTMPEDKEGLSDPQRHAHTLIWFLSFKFFPDSWDRISESGVIPRPLCEIGKSLNCRKILLLGPPGSGKSQILKFMSSEWSLETSFANEYIYSSESFTLSVVDLTGAESTSGEWLEQVETGATLMFVASLVSYSKSRLSSDGETEVNDLELSLRLFADLINSKWFRSSGIILLLNKTDLLRDLLKKEPMHHHLPLAPKPKESMLIGLDEGNEDSVREFDEYFEKCADFIARLFFKRNLDPISRTVYTHQVSAMDPVSMKRMFTDVFSIVNHNMNMTRAIHE